MNLIPSKVGAEPKKLMMLGGLGAVILVVWFLNRTPSAPPAAPAVVREFKDVPDIPAPRVAASTSGGARVQTRTANGRNVARSGEDFKPSLKLKEGMDVRSIDPSIHLELLAKMRQVEASAGGRSLFDFGAAPAPPVPEVKIQPTAAWQGPRELPPPPPPPPPPTPPPPAPIPLKFYGYAGTPRSGSRGGFFLDGEEIIVARENELYKNRYKVIRVGVNSAVVEDTQGKNQQTLPLVEESQ